MLETLFYLASVMESGRSLIRCIANTRLLALSVVVSAILPYTWLTIAAGTFHWQILALIAGMAAVFTFWNVLSPRRWVYDAGFLVIAGAPILLKTFKHLYLTSGPPRLEILGQLMWVRVGLISLLLFRKWDAGPIGLWPTLREWRIGFVCFLSVIAPLIALAVSIHDLSWHPQPGSTFRIFAIAIGTFFGIFWVVALSEEVFFRGFVQRALLNAQLGPTVAISLATLLYGASHLWFHSFPDWRTSLVAAVLGIGCGIAYWRSGSVRASMVTHAMAVTTWRLLFK